MIEERRVIDAFKTSAITCVALLDDAFDPPPVPEEHMGAALDLLNGLAPGELSAGIIISAEEIAAASEALNAGEYTADALQLVFARLFSAYVATDNGRFDPGGAFKTQKANNLNYVRPLLALLRKCDPQLEIILCGSQETEMDEAAKRAQLIFVDYFLNANLSPDGDPNEEQKKRGREASLARLRELIAAHRESPDGMPAVILMSSHKVEHCMDKFREEVAQDKGGVFAARFDFLQKMDVTTVQDGHIAIKASALDALLGIVQSFAFGRAAFLALQQWKIGADKAIEQVWRDVNTLKIKDFAYLTRFRLSQEGMNLSEYLEWFFGECLNDAISHAVDWSHKSFMEVDQPNGPAKQIRGAFDGATDQIARMFDRVRVMKPRAEKRHNYRMGDLYIGTENGSGKKVRAILTPDCDLLVRTSGKPKAMRLLTVGGVLRDIHAGDAPIADFILIDENPQCVRWNLKDVRTYDFNQWPRPDSNGRRVWKFFGTLRPLYAYELRERVLEDLARVGLNVPPALGSSATATAIVDGAEQDYEIPLAEETGKAACSLVLSRGGSDTTHVIFYESAVARLISGLRTVDASAMSERETQTILRKIQSKATEQDKLIEKLTATGLAVEKDGVLGIKVTTKATGRGAKGRPWCQIVLSNELISPISVARARTQPNQPQKVVGLRKVAAKLEAE